MTVTLTYDNVLSRVQIEATSLDLSATEALVERSTDQVKWVTVRGAAEVVVVNGEFAVPVSDYEFVSDTENFYRVTPDVGATETNSITPVLEFTWLKSLARPFLNMSFAQSEIVTEVRRGSRDGIFHVVGRSLPIAITDVRMSRQYGLRLVTRTFNLGNNLDALLASGDILFLHAPSSWPYRSAYFVPEMIERSLRWSTEWSTWTLAVVEVVAPGPDVIGSTSTYQTVVNNYATYNDVLLAHTEYAEILELIGSPDEVIVP